MVRGKAFEEAKSQLISSCLPIHFDPDRDLVLARDTLPQGVGTVWHTKWMTTQRN